LFTEHSYIIDLDCCGTGRAFTMIPRHSGHVTSWDADVIFLLILPWAPNTA